MVYGIFAAHHWRRAIGLVLAYVLLVQSTLALTLVTRGSVSADPAISGSFFVICSSAAGHSDGADGLPSGVDHAHCPLCVLSTALAGATPAMVAVVLSAPVGISSAVSFFAMQSMPPARFPRAGETRGPPSEV